VNYQPIGEEKMPRQTQVTKMGKRKRVSTWGTKAKKKVRRYNPVRGISVRNSDFGFPDTLSTKLKYADFYNLTSASGLVSNQVMQLNSLFDPDFSGVGHQPMFFDQLCGAVGSAPYSRYRVAGATIKVTFSVVSPPSLAVTNVTPVMVGVISQRNSGLNAATTSALLETDNCQWKLLGDKGSGASSCVIYNKYNPANDFGIDPTDDALASAYTGSPSLGWYAHLFKVDETGASTVRAFVEIVYDCVFFSRNEVNQS